MIVLSAGDWSATVLPALGGSILGLEHAGRPVFRPTPAGSDDILQTACFPLVPYANRIADGRFSFGERDVTLPVLPQFAPHALHGDGWLRPWTVDAADKTSVTLRLSGGGDHWPWAWTAVQTVTVAETGLQVVLTATNDADEPAPMGLGLHPYFHRAPDARLTLWAQDVWLTTDDIPQRLAEPGEIADWSSGLVLSEAPFVDHAYAGWDGRAVIAGDGRTVILSATDTARWTQVYAPKGEAFLCVEPVTHRPDALNAPPGEATGLVVLQPGENLSVGMSITAG